MQGSKNIKADAFCSLDIIDNNNPFEPNMLSLAENFSLEKEDVQCPLNYKTIIIQYQQKR